MTTNERNVFLENMQNYVESEYSWFQNILDFLDWNISDLNQTMVANISDETECKYASCSFLPEHRMPVDRLEFHMTNCAKKYERYPLAVESSLMDIINSEIQESNLNILPSSINDSKNSKLGKKSIQQSSSKCLMELLTAERDAKRRRAAHRGKRVHSNKKSYNEILKEIIDNEMKTFGECNEIEPQQAQDGFKNSTTSVSKKEFMYEGVGSLYYKGNPYKRWKTIREEEWNFLKRKNTNVEYAKKCRQDSSENVTGKSIPDLRHDVRHYKNEYVHQDSFSFHSDIRNHSSSEREIEKQYQYWEYEKRSCSREIRVRDSKQYDSDKNYAGTSTDQDVRKKCCRELRKDLLHTGKKIEEDITREFIRKDVSDEKLIRKIEHDFNSKAERKFSSSDHHCDNNPRWLYRKRIRDSSREKAVIEKKRNRKGKKHKKKDHKKKKHRSRHSP